MSEGVSGKVCIITGASSGFGEATAILFAKKGASVVLCGRNQERLQGVLDRCIEESGGNPDRFLTVLGDVTEANVRENIVWKTIQKYARLDVLVANAGVNIPGSSVRDATEQTFDNMFNINVKSVFFLIQQALPYLEKSKGSIISVSSCTSTLSRGPIALYAMSKAALDHMTRCLAVDLGPKGIRVNAINPSFVSTRITRYMGGVIDDINQRVEDRENAKHPLGECGKPDDIANAILFLASNVAKFITGECLPVDGGRVLIGTEVSAS